MAIICNLGRILQHKLIWYFPGPTHGDELQVTILSLFLTNATYYLQGDKDFAVRMLGYWMNFVKYDEPSYGQKNSIWSTFLDVNLSGNGQQLGDLSNVGRRIKLTNNGFNMVTGYAENHCGFWKYT